MLTADKILQVQIAQCTLHCICTSLAFRSLTGRTWYDSGCLLLTCAELSCLCCAAVSGVVLAVKRQRGPVTSSGERQHASAPAGIEQVLHGGAVAAPRLQSPACPIVAAVCSAHNNQQRCCCLLPHHDLQLQRLWLLFRCVQHTCVVPFTP
jgi:hypothetical protein